MTWFILATSFITVGLMEILQYVKVYFYRREMRRRTVAFIDQLLDFEDIPNDEKPPDV